MAEINEKSIKHWEEFLKKQQESTIKYGPYARLYFFLRTSHPQRTMAKILIKFLFSGPACMPCLPQSWMTQNSWHPSTAAHSLCAQPSLTLLPSLLPSLSFPGLLPTNTQTHIPVPAQTKFCAPHRSPLKNNCITESQPNEFNKKSTKEFLQGSFTNFHVLLNSFHYYIHGTLYFSEALPWQQLLSICLISVYFPQ